VAIWVNNSDDQEEPDASEALSPEDDNDATEERNEVNPRSAKYMKVDCEGPLR
jgi:hypothetical protein